MKICLWQQNNLFTFRQSLIRKIVSSYVKFENLIVLSKDEFLKTLLPINALIGVSWEVSLESKLMAKSPSIILLL